MVVGGGCFFPFFSFFHSAFATRLFLETRIRTPRAGGRITSKFIVRSTRKQKDFCRGCDETIFRCKTEEISLRSSSTMITGGMLQAKFPRGSLLGDFMYSSAGPTLV